MEHAQEYSQNSGGIFIPFNDIDIIEGQGTALEIMEEMEDFDILVGCVGGGGLEWYRWVFK